MALNFIEYYQLGDNAPIIFEDDLIRVVKMLGRPRPEFRGAKLRDDPEGVSQWLIQCSIRGRMVYPHSEVITFEITECSWADGLARAMHEALTRLCGAHGEELSGGYRYFPRRDSTGRPMNVPCHRDLGKSVDHQDFLLFSTQQELDRARARAELLDFALVEARDTIRILAKDRKTIRRQRVMRDTTIPCLRGKVAILEKTISDLEEHLEEVEGEGIDLHKERDAFLSDEDDFQEEMDMEKEEDDEEELIEDIKEEPEAVISEEEEDPEELVFEPED